MFAELIYPGMMGVPLLGPAECKNGGTPTGVCSSGTSPVLPPKCRLGWVPAIDD